MICTVAIAQVIFILIIKTIFYWLVKIQMSHVICIMEKIMKQKKMYGHIQVDVCQSFQFLEKKKRISLCSRILFEGYAIFGKKSYGGKYDNGTWQFKDVVSVPYVHRFGIFNQNGINYLILATVATSKKEKNDWSVPGRIYVAELPEDPSKGVELEVLCDGLYRNHGFWQTKEDGKDVGYFGSDQGILRVSAPEKTWWTMEGRNQFYQDILVRLPQSILMEMVRMKS